MPIDGFDIDELVSMIGLMASGLSDGEIARRLGLSVRTVRRRMAQLFEAVGASNRFQAGYLLAQRYGHRISPTDSVD